MFCSAATKYDVLIKSAFVTMIILINHYAIPTFTLKTKESKVRFDYPEIRTQDEVTA